MVVGKHIPKSSESLADKRFGTQMEWRLMLELLEKGETESLADTLQQIQSNSPEANQSNLRVLLAAAYQICQAYRRSHQEIVWHHTAYQKAAQRSTELRQQLDTLLTQISNYQQTSEHPILGEQSGESDNKKSNGNAEPERTGKRPTWWQRVQKALRFGRNGQTIDQPESALPPALPSDSLSSLSNEPIANPKLSGETNSNGKSNRTDLTYVDAVNNVEEKNICHQFPHRKPERQMALL